MKSGTSAPKMHHFVPRSYLARFTDRGGFLHVFDRSSCSFRRQRPKEVMKINSYYRQDWAPSGVDPNIFEKTLGGWLERDAKESIDRLIHYPATPVNFDRTGSALRSGDIRRPRSFTPRADFPGLWKLRAVRFFVWGSPVCAWASPRTSAFRLLLRPRVRPGFEALWLRKMQHIS